MRSSERWCRGVEECNPRPGAQKWHLRGLNDDQGIGSSWALVVFGAERTRVRGVLGVGATARRVSPPVCCVLSSLQLPHAPVTTSGNEPRADVCSLLIGSVTRAQGALDVAHAAQPGCQASASNARSEEGAVQQQQQAEAACSGGSGRQVQQHMQAAGQHPDSGSIRVASRASSATASAATGLADSGAAAPAGAAGGSSQVRHVSEHAWPLLLAFWIPLVSDRLSGVTIIIIIASPC
jgi:hypothetical protein